MRRWGRRTGWWKDFWGPADTHLRLSFEWVSISFLVRITRPKIWVHSETMLPATCPHFELGSDLANRTIQKAPVISRKMLRECSCSFSSTGLSQWRGGLRLSAGVGRASCREDVV